MGVASQLMMLFTCVLAVYVGGRTLRVAAHTRGVAELAIGLNVSSIAIGGGILTVIGAMGRTNPDAFGTLAYELGMAWLALHLIAIYFGTWLIFRPTRRWVLVPCLVALGLIGFWFSMALGPDGSIHLRPILFQALRGIGMTWSAFECFHYSDRLRRQAALGLADPMMAHRFWLWAVGATSALVVCTIELVGFGLAGTSASGHPLGLMVQAGLGLASAVAVALAFFPPAAYEHRVRARLGGVGAPARAAGGEAG